MEFWENKLSTEINSGYFELSVVASYTMGSIKYIIRIQKPNWDKVDYVISLDGLKKLGQLLLDLSSFAEKKLNVNDGQKIRELLTRENIRQHANLEKTLKIS